jgi:hypothetical protein
MAAIKCHESASDYGLSSFTDGLEKVVLTPELIDRCKHRRAFHRTTVVCVKSKLIFVDFVGVSNRLKKAY